MSIDVRLTVICYDPCWCVIELGKNCWKGLYLNELCTTWCDKKGKNTIKEAKTALILDTQTSKMLFPVTIW